jgi:C4-dicarboxylate-specific signal transduction histidine kinase
MKLQKIRHVLIVPRSTDQDVARRELILNILLFGMFLVTLAALIAELIDLAEGLVVNGIGSLIITAVFFIFVIGLRLVARAGYQQSASYVLLSLVGLLAVSTMLQWSYELPAAELCFGLLFVVSGILLGAKAALRFNFIALILFLAISYAQIARWLHPRINWLNQGLHLADAIGYAVVFCIIILVSWLANREVDRALKRAQTSEAALALERDNLELKVIERTHELQDIQSSRLMELQRFAEFGRLSANLLHEVANPLTAASLTLEQLDAQQQSQLSLQARENVSRIQRYVVAARKQLSGHGEIGRFSVKDEVNTTLISLEPLSRSAKVSLTLLGNANYYLVGDAIKFNQVLRNALSNAIESYAGSKLSINKRRVELSFQRESEFLTCSIQDWGTGISGIAMEEIFKPFYTTKRQSGNNLGIGLSMIKRFVEEDFKGEIIVTSKPKTGTRFQLSFRLRL